MTLQRRSFTSLPPYLQSNRNNLELAVTDDPLYEPEQAAFVSGYIGDTSQLTAEQLARTPLLVENTKTAQKYQFTVGVAEKDPVTQEFVSGAFYDDLVNHIAVNGGLVNDPNRLFASNFYVWTPPVDYDKIVNFARYFWTGGGPATTSGEYITKEPAGTVVTIYQFNGSTLTEHAATVIDGVFPSTPNTGDVVEDVSTTDRYLYQYDGTAWGRLSFQVAPDTTLRSYAPGDWVYITRTGPDFNRPIVWCFRPDVGRWVSLQVVINSLPPTNPVKGMLWEDTRLPPARVLRIWDGANWQTLFDGLHDVFDATPVTYTSGSPGGIPSGVTYLYDTRSLSEVDTWSANNWWRVLDDITGADQAALGQQIQAARPIIEFWGNIETATGDQRHARDQFPLFNLYAVSPALNYQIRPLTIGSDFPNLETTGNTSNGRYWNGSTIVGTRPKYTGGNIVSPIFQYVVPAVGAVDQVLGFAVSYGSDGTPQYSLDMEALPINQNGAPLPGYRFFLDSSTGYVYSVWQKSSETLVQTADDDGLYDLPRTLSSNADHVLTTSTNRSSFINHFTAVIGAQAAFTGTPFGGNSYRFSPKNMVLGGQMIDPEESLFRVMAVLQTGRIDIPDAIRMMGRIYNSTMARFINQLNTLWNNGTLSTVTDDLTMSPEDACNLILTNMFQGRNAEFPFYYSVMGTFTPTRLNAGVPYHFDDPQPIYIPNSPAQVGAAPAYFPHFFTDRDGVTKLRGHDGSLLTAFGDARDIVMMELETRFYDAVPDHLKEESLDFSSRYNRSNFRLENYYGDFKPNLTAGTVTDVVADYTAVGSPVTGARIYATNQQVFAVWDGTQWLLQNAQTNDVFQDTGTGDYYIFNGFFTENIPTDNHDVTFDYSILEYRQVVEREFERFVVSHDLDFVTNTEFDENDPFTWNYSSAGLEGNYRGIYRRVYNTIRPHSHPWEVVGYSIMPEWWFDAYTPDSTAPDGTPRYANTHQMWADFQDGVINPMTSPETLDPAHQMIAPIPVDSAGELIDPIASGLVVETALTPSSVGDDWQYGDGGVVEDNWYASYFYPWSVALAGYLMKPGLFVDRTWSEFYRTIGDVGAALFSGPAVVYNATLNRPQAAQVPSQLSLDSAGEQVQNPGLNSWIAEYSVLIGKNANTDFNNAILYSQAALGWKTSGFINHARTSFELLSSDEITSEDFSVVLHQGPSINEYFQSGITVVRDTDGFRIFGTDTLNPFFTVELGAKPLSGGQIELLETFTYDGKNRTFTVTQFNIPPATNDTATFAVLVNGFSLRSQFVQRLSATQFSIDPSLLLTAGDQITASMVTIVSNPSTQLGSFVVNNVTVTYFQTGSGVYVTYPYGHLFETLNDVVNMLVGHGRWLGQQGWVFERLTNGVLRDWLGAGKAFAIWATQLGTTTLGNPLLQKGQIFNYSVMGRQAQFNADFGMILGIENTRNGAYGIVDVNSQPIEPNNLDIVSTGGSIMVSSGDTDIYGLRIYVSVVQHVVFFPNITTFGDIIYEPALGLAQPALYVTTYRTTNWNGRMEAPGFLVSGGQLAPIPVIPPGQIATPIGALFPNWEKQVADITRYYDRFNPPDDPVLTAMARDLFGYAPKDYINRLAADDRTQFNFYRGTLKAKGTRQPYFAFARGTTVGIENLTVAEDWAWKFTRYGDRRVATILFTVNADDFVDTYQVIAFHTNATDNRIIQIPQFSPPTGDDRWVIPPPEDYYPVGAPYRFPTLDNGSVNLTKYVYSAFLVDQNGVSPATNLFHWDPTAGIHEPFAFSKIEYATVYDPARYNAGPQAGTDDNLIWNGVQVGQVWWSTSTAIYSNYKGFLPDVMQTSREWGKLKYFYATITRANEIVTVTTLDSQTRNPVAHNLVTGQTVSISGADQPTYNGTFTVTVASSTTFTFTVTQAADTPATGDITISVGQINCYEWVASPVPPDTWEAFVDAQSGFTPYTGAVLNADNPSYSVQSILDPNGNTITTYYFWVENNTRPIPGKGISVSDIAGRLRSPAVYEIPYFGIMDSGTIFVFIGADTVSDNYGVEISYTWQEMPRHIEWLLIGEGSDFELVPTLVTDKLVDSILSVDTLGNPVPNATLAPADIYGTLNFPAQTVFQSITDALNVYVSAVNQFLVGVDLVTLPDVFADLTIVDETSNDPSEGFWTRATYWDPSVNHAVIYDTVSDLTELNFRADMMLYAAGDVVKVLESDQTDLWTGDSVAAYYLYDGSAFSLVGIDAHTASINSNIKLDVERFRDFFTDLTTGIDILDANAIIFTLLHEMVRQNPMIDWFFKTSYIDPHVTLSIPAANFVEPDQAGLIFDAILDLKPYRTKIRDAIVGYALEDELGTELDEQRLTKDTLVFDRLACDLNDENAWDTIPWDATASYPESAGLVVTFVGDSIQRCFTLPIIPTTENLVVYINGQLAIPNVDYRVDPIGHELCFTVAPATSSIISVHIDSSLQYSQSFSYQFAGDGVTDSVTLSEAMGQASISDVFSSWNGVHQIPTTDYVLQVTSTTDVVYNTPPPSDIEVSGFVVDAVVDAIFNRLVFVGNGSTSSYATGSSTLASNGVVVMINGVLQSFDEDYTLDDSNPSDIHVALHTPLALNAVMMVYAAVDSGNLASEQFVFTGDGSTTFFDIPNDILTTTKVLVNLAGIEQLENIDFYVSTAGIQFVTAPAVNVVVNIFVIWSSVGHRLTAVSSPTTVQWDWAFWNYADLGRQEYDLVGVAVGDDTTTHFTIGIPLTTSTLYNTKLELYYNGVLTTPGSVGMVITVTQLSNSVLLDFNTPMPATAYTALYVSRGFYQGLEPTFGYQDPAGVVFSPTPSSYQHYFARLITSDFDPSTIMSGCPTSSEERVQTEADDTYTIVVKTFIQDFEAPPNLLLAGVAAQTEVGTFTFLDTSSIPIVGVSTTAVTGVFPGPRDIDMLGVEGTAGTGTLSPSLGFVGDAATAEIGTFDLSIGTDFALSGVSAISNVGPFGSNLEGLEVTAEVGDIEVLTPTAFAGVSAGTGVGSFSPAETKTMTGVEGTTQMGTLHVSISFGQAGITEVGSFSFTIDRVIMGVAATSGRGVLGVTPKLVDQSGVEATTAVGSIAVQTSF